MPMYKTQTITGKPDGYHYSDEVYYSARSPRHAAGRHCDGIDHPRPNEVCVIVCAPEDSPPDGDVYLATLAEDGEYAIRTAVTPTALRIARALVKICDEIEDLSIDDADSLRRLLESIAIDAVSADVGHPASREFNVNLNTTDALAGIRLLIHCAHDLPDLDHSEIETGGFSPVDGDS